MNTKTTFFNSILWAGQIETKDSYIFTYYSLFDKSNVVFSKAFTKVFEHHQKDKDGNTIPHEDELVTEYEKQLSEEKSRKYKVRVTDPKTEKSYVRYADREKITALRGKGLKVEMTEYGTPYEGERKKGEQTAKALGGGKKSKGSKLDPVGKEDKDVNNDGKVNKTDSYLMNANRDACVNANMFFNS